MARPSKLNIELIKRIGEELATGLPMTTVCDYLSITTASISNWMIKGEKDFNNEDETLEAELFDTIKKSRAEFERFANKRIVAGEQGWQGTAWWLERTRTQYMPKQEVVAEEGKVQVIIGGKNKNVREKDNQ